MTYGITLVNSALEQPYNYQDVTLSTATSARLWLPYNLAAGATVRLVVFNHPSGQSQTVDRTTTSPSGNMGWYPMIQGLLDAGYVVIAPAAGGSGTPNWGNAAALADVAAAKTYVTGLGFTVSKVGLLGGSMGALLNDLVLAAGTVTNIKGVYSIDGVHSLLNMYTPSLGFQSAMDTAYTITRGTLSGNTVVGATSLPTTASFPTIGTQLLVGVGTANVETVTTTGASNGTSVAVTAFANTHASADQVSNYPTKTAGHDPVLMLASAFGTVAYRFVASSSDTTVAKTANTDVMQALIAATASESVILTPNTAGHLDTGHYLVADLLTFLARVFA